MGLSQHMREPASVSKERLLEAGVTTGTLDAWMLNPDVVFESLVRRMAPTPERGPTARGKRFSSDSKRRSKRRARTAMRPSSPR